MHDEPDDIPREFTDEQLERALKEVGNTARRNAFKVGRPVMILVGENLVLQYEDGREEIVGNIHDGLDRNPE